MENTCLQKYYHQHDCASFSKCSKLMETYSKRFADVIAAKEDFIESEGLNTVQ